MFYTQKTRTCIELLLIKQNVTIRNLTGVQSNNSVPKDMSQNDSIIEEYKWTNNGVYIRNIYILYNSSQLLPTYFNNIWFCVLSCHCGVTLFGLFKLELSLQAIHTPTIVHYKVEARVRCVVEKTWALQFRP